MNENSIDLLAAYWTIAGDVYPCAPSEVSPFPLQARAEAAAKAGWKGIGLVLDDLKAAVAQVGVSGVRNILADNGMKHFELEILVDWYKSGELRAASDQFRRDVIELGGALGMRNLKIGASFADEGPADFPRMAAEFAKLCEEVSSVGATVSLEFMPFSIVRNIQDGLAIVEAADQPNGGLTVDTWHVVRGGSSYDEIAKIPSRFIKSIELDDADEQVVGTLFEDTRFNRRLCGEGVYNAPAFIEAVQQAGFAGPYYGVEILSQSFRKLPLEEMAKRAFDSTMAQFAAVEARKRV
ncbi:sugar phosphate isomerase/epimerase family protein [Collimonas silvisoli]|uniref:sugar phosphate isomerase/epimerase family protein n=1 Tax=Collimonas silvisoli TaxID=2825884 RepID=UPI001B8C17E6|nr:sugar phosphate isomerase/epimerase [Collimonas silvisoli]